MYQHATVSLLPCNWINCYESCVSQQLNQLAFQEVTLKRELSSLGEVININALENWDAVVAEYLADLKAVVDELKTVTPQTPEEQHEVLG